MIFIDYNDKRPIYEQIVDRFQTLILNGALEPDEKIPSVRSLAVELSINPNTIQRAYRELEQNGYIYTVKGRGNFVRANQSLAEEQKKKLINTLREQIAACRDMGISREEVTTCTDEVYKEVDYDRD